MTRETEINNLKNGDRVEYHYTECGLDNVLIQNMPAIIDDDGDEMVLIHDIGLLHAVIVLDLVEKVGSWSAKELRFVRTEMGKTQAELGALVNKDRQAIARWEKGECDIDRNAETVLRLLAAEHLCELGILARVGESDERPPMKEVIDRTRPSSANRQIRLNRVDDGYTRVKIAA